MSSREEIEKLTWQNRPDNGLPYAQRTVEIFITLRSPELVEEE